MVYVLKMEYVSKINIFGLNMMVKSGLEKIFLEIPPCAHHFLLKMNLPHRKEEFWSKVQIQ